MYSIHLITSYVVKDKSKSPEKYSGRGEYVLFWPICKWINLIFLRIRSSCTPFWICIGIKYISLSSWLWFYTLIYLYQSRWIASFMYGKEHPFIKTVHAFKYFPLELLLAKQKKKIAISWIPIYLVNKLQKYVQRQFGLKTIEAQNDVVEHVIVFLDVLVIFQRRLHYNRRIIDIIYNWKSINWLRCH